MNKQFWNKIKKDYPLAYEECEKWICKEIETEMPDFLLKVINLRDLYDFFDKRKIFITIDQPSDFECHNILDKWQYLITIIDGNIFHDNKYYTSRPQAEKTAFKKAFEILNNQLKDK